MSAPKTKPVKPEKTGSNLEWIGPSQRSKISVDDQIEFLVDQYIRKLPINELLEKHKLSSKKSAYSRSNLARKRLETLSQTNETVKAKLRAAKLIK